MTGRSRPLFPGRCAMIADNLKRVMDGITEAAIVSERNPSDITLVAVTKTRTVEEIGEALAAGVVHLGENRVQEAALKIPAVRGNPVWHLVGSLQSNKAARAAELFGWIDSVHSEKVAGILSERAEALGKTLDILVQVNISGEESKSGVSPDEAGRIVSAVERLPGIRLRGLMTIGSFGAPPDKTRREFRRMRELFDSLRSVPERRTPFDTLSMGMSGDFRIAIEEGSTMVRVGTAIFGERT